MSQYRALYLYTEILRGFARSMAVSGDLASTLSRGFNYLTSRLKIQNIGLFWWDPDTAGFRMQYTFEDGTLMEGEEEILVELDHPLWDLVRNRRPVIVSKKTPWIAYIPIRSEGQLVGAVRIRRNRRLPRGSVLGMLPSWDGYIENADRRYPFLNDLADLLSNRISALFKEERHLKNEQYFRAGTEISTAVVEMPRLREMLQSVSASIVKNLGFDRVRIYLSDPAKFELIGFAGVQIPNNTLELEKEVYSLRDNRNPLVETVLSGSGEIRVDNGGQKVVYVPLMVGRQAVGLMVVDNLLSQQDIDLVQQEALRTMAGQIAMAIVNARLFEDIEQQAITDGLTHLYVFRYFQQRLKEEIDRADRYSYGVALVMMDVDNFKGFNDTYGHQLGDKVLEFLSQAIRSNIRRIDLAARYGGDEFVLLLPEITQQEAWLMGTRLLNALKDCTLRSNDGKLIPVQVTMGVALYPTDAQNGRDLIENADRALYWAKRNRRGDICFFRDTPPEVKIRSTRLEKMA